jgi:hypothetical protein
MIGFIDIFYTPLGPIAIIELPLFPNTSQFTLRHTPWFSFFTSRILATDL